MKVIIGVLGVVINMAFYSSSARAFSRTLLARRGGGATPFIARTMSTTAEAVSTNPLLQNDDLPKFEHIEPSHLSAAVETLLSKLESDFTSLEDKLSQESEPDYEEVLPEVERMQFPLGYAWGIAGHLNGVKNGDELREAYEKNQPEIVKIFSKFSQSKPLYDALSAIEKKVDNSDSFEARQRRRAVELSLRSMKLGGVGLEGAEKERFNEIKMRLAALATTFSNNVLDETKAFSLTITDASKLEGVPESAKAMWANAHIMHLQSEGESDIPEMDAEKGPWRITLDMPSYIAVLSHVPDRELREQVYKANIQRASEKNNDKNNVPLIYEILTLKAEMAKMLGFNNYAELSLAI